MSPDERRPCDEAIRERVTTDLATTFLLEASAGTGKTKVLVDRYVRCVLDPELGAGDVRTVAAITFTEKAAGELRQRIREELEVRAAVSRDRAEAQLLQEALDALDDAPISTIHSFAGRLLREFPVEAGVDPAFEQLDALAGELTRAGLWEEWLGLLATDGDDAHGEEAARSLAPGCRAFEGPRAWLSRLLQAGVSLTALRDLAAGVFAERYDVDPASGPAPEPDLRLRLADLAGPLAALGGFCQTACADPADKGCATALRLVEAVGRLLAAPPDGLDELAGALYALPVKTGVTAPGGRQDAWDATLGGKSELQSRYQTLVGAIAGLCDAYASYLTSLAIAVADAFARWAGDCQLALGRLDFTDLLGRLRDLLAHDLPTRRLLQQRFRFVLVDEFQDTDPLQAEIVLFLCEREATATIWRDVILEPGKLFLVGDPKQSIYRFRRADIALYDQVKRVIAGQPEESGEVLAISQNFRTTPAITTWVNEVFDPVFALDAAEGRQPRYERVEAYRPPLDGPRVDLLLGREYSGAAGESDAARRDEAEALAGLLVALHDGESGRWHVQDREAAAEGDAEPQRPPRWGDVAVLVRQTTGLETYEQAFREAGVPYRVDGGKTYFDRREVADVLLCLRAADDPSDAPALYGALHSCLFGFSDDDLFLFWAAGGRFDVFASRQPEGHDEILAAMAVLRELHDQGAAREAHELVSALVRLTGGAPFLAATGPGAPQAIANLDKLVERARAFGEAGGGGLTAFLKWAAQATDAAGEQESQAGDDGDVVRVLTIHKAKGLEYPIVVLAGGALAGGSGDSGPIVDRDARSIAVKLKADLPGAPRCDIEPSAYADLHDREQAMEASELRRLLYVAATRARDHLVLSCFGRLRTQKGDFCANVLLAPLASALPSASAIGDGESEHERLRVLAPAPTAGRVAAQEQACVETLLEERRLWTQARDRLLAEASRPLAAVSPSGLEQVDQDLEETAGSWAPGRATALALGSIVHRVMELCDLDDETCLQELAASAAFEAGRPELADRAEGLARACWRAAPVRDAAASPRVYRELPVGAFLGGAIVGGAIDLLYEGRDGWVVVDYKTDATSDEAEVTRRYTPQGAAYALAVEAAVGAPVREVVFVRAAHEGRCLRVPVDDVLRADGLRAIEGTTSLVEP